MSGTKKRDAQNGMERVSVNVDSSIVFVIINDVEMMINADVNAQN